MTAAIVDLDGTLVDTLGDFALALNGALAELRLPALPRTEIEPLVGRGSEHLIRKALARVGASELFYEDAWHSYQLHYKAANGTASTVYAGAIDGLTQLRAAGAKLACVTNKPAAFAKHLLEAKGLASLFDVLFGGDAFERKKPDPLPVIKACEALGSTPSQTLVIGDSMNDAAAARAAGCPVLLVTYGYNHGEPIRSVDADGFIDSLAEIGAWIRAGGFTLPASRAARP